MNNVYELIHSICMLDNRLEEFNIDGMSDVQLKSLLKIVKYEVKDQVKITKSIQPDLYHPSKEPDNTTSDSTLISQDKPSGDGFLNNL